jgi:hypothetical protein
MKAHEYLDLPARDGLPVMLCKKKSGNSVNQWVFNCPNCRRKVHHGGGDFKDDDLGHRVAHCCRDAFPDGYYLEFRDNKSNPFAKFSLRNKIWKMKKVSDETINQFILENIEEINKQIKEVSDSGYEKNRFILFNPYNNKIIGVYPTRDEARLQWHNNRDYFSGENYKTETITLSEIEERVKTKLKELTQQIKTLENIK